MTRTIIEILFTNSCNRNCAYCVGRSKDKTYRGKQQKNNEYGDYKLESGIINMPQLKRWLIAQRGRFDDIRLIISGGEPTLLRHYTEFLDWCGAKGFARPIIYTNGANIKDLALCERDPKGLARVLLTHHLDSDENATREYVKFLKDIKVDFIVKLLTNEKDMRPFGDSLDCKYVVEGLRDLYSDDIEVKKRQVAEHNPFTGESPYRWRWDGYGDLIDRRRTAWKESVVLTITPPGIIFNCHLFDSPVGDIYETGRELANLQIAACPYGDTYNQATMECKETRCEMQHYINLFDEDF